MKPLRNGTGLSAARGLLAVGWWWLVLLVGSSCPGQLPLIPAGATWKYRDDGASQPPAWRQLTFDDSRWSAGPAQLGYGNGDETTVVNSGPPLNRFVTTYFRHTFIVNGPQEFSSLTARLLRDDGAVVYLNGVEVFRSNMPTGAVTSATRALTAAPPGDGRTNFFPAVINPSLLVPGPNVLAVEVHLFSPGPPNPPDVADLSFDLMLQGTPAGFLPTVTGPPDQIVAINGQLMLHAEATGEPLSFQWLRNGMPLPDDPRILGATSPDLLIAPAFAEDSGDYTIIVANPFGEATAHVQVKVVGPPQIIVQPISQTAPFCAQVTFAVDGTECPNWQWFRNGAPLPDATNATLVLTNVQRPEVGVYWAVGANPAGLAQSAPAELQILLQKSGIVTNALIARDDLTLAPPAFAGFAPAAGGGPVPTLPLLHGVPLLFTTFGATKQAGEPNHCGVVGGHSKWAYYFSTRAESLRVSTEGSDFDTVLAVYTWNGSDFSTLSLKACNNNSGPGRLASVVRFPASAGTIYYVAVDGVSGAIGTVRLQVGEGALHSPVVTNGQFQFAMTGHGGRTYRLQSATVMETNAASWTTVLTTNVPAGVPDWVLPYATNITAGFPRRYYRGLEQ